MYFIVHYNLSATWFASTQTNLWITDTGKEGLSLYFNLCEDVTCPCTEPGHKRCWLFEAFNSCVGVTCSNWLGQDPDLRLSPPSPNTIY